MTASSPFIRCRAGLDLVKDLQHLGERQVRVVVGVVVEALNVALGLSSAHARQVATRVSEAS